MGKTYLMKYVVFMGTMNVTSAKRWCNDLKVVWIQQKVYLMQTDRKQQFRQKRFKG
jgi:hypothetical protein